MERAVKQQVVDKLHSSLATAGVVVVSHYKGLTVAEISALRIKARDAGAKLQVTKNTLAKRALEGTEYAQLADLMKGPTAVTWSDDPIAAAKVVAGFAKENDKLIVLGGAMGDKKLDAKGVVELSKMPSLDELRAKIIGLLQAPAAKMVGVLQAPAGQVARVMGAYAQKGE